MSKIFARPLSDHKSINTFLVNCLGATAVMKFGSGIDLPTSAVVKKIRDAESAVLNIDPSVTTLLGDANRFPEYGSTASRADLRNRIVAELMALDRLVSDEHIKLGYGGAKPMGKEAAAGKQAYVVIGLPASGKSRLVSKISDALGAVILDSDFAKRKIPEFHDTLGGAQLVHAESNAIVFGQSMATESPSLLSGCVSAGIDVVIPPHRPGCG